MWPPQPWEYGEDDRLVDAQNLFQSALNAEDVREEERFWTVLIDKLDGISDAPWLDDTLARVYGNRGNSRGRQGKLQEALKDYEKAQASARLGAAPFPPTGRLCPPGATLLGGCALATLSTLGRTRVHPCIHTIICGSKHGLARFVATASLKDPALVVPLVSFVNLHCRSLPPMPSTLC